jgi:hypothetical protein
VTRAGSASGSQSVGARKESMTCSPSDNGAWTVIAAPPRLRLTTVASRSHCPLACATTARRRTARRGWTRKCLVFEGPTAADASTADPMPPCPPSRLATRLAFFAVCRLPWGGMGSARSWAHRVKAVKQATPKKGDR